MALTCTVAIMELLSKTETYMVEVITVLLEVLDHILLIMLTIPGQN